MSDGMKFAITAFIMGMLFFWSVMYWASKTDKMTPEERMSKTYENCVSILFTNGQAEKIPNCEYIKKQ